MKKQLISFVLLLVIITSCEKIDETNKSLSIPPHSQQKPDNKELKIDDSNLTYVEIVLPSGAHVFDCILPPSNCSPINNNKNASNILSYNNVDLKYDKNTLKWKEKLSLSDDDPILHGLVSKKYIIKQTPSFDTNYEMFVVLTTENIIEAKNQLVHAYKVKK